MKYRVKIVDTTIDLYEVFANSEEEAQAAAEEIHYEGGPGTEYHVGGWCEERQRHVEKI